MDKKRLEVKSKDLRVCYDYFEALNIRELHARCRVLAVIGHNGSGKSTFIKTALGLLEPRAGTLELAWYNNWSERERLIPEKHMAYSPENGAVFSDMTVENYIKLWCRIMQGDANYYKTTGSNYIEAMGVNHLLRKLGRTLSKGEKRRVQTAVGFLTNPRLFLFDEPFDGLDVRQASELSEILKSASTQMGLIISSHQMSVVERLADMILVLKNGEVFTLGPVEDVAKTLSGKTLMIKFKSEDSAFETCQGLNSLYPGSLVHQVGNRVSLTGAEADRFEVSSWCYENAIDQFEIEETSPNLTDAMGYHLLSTK